MKVTIICEYLRKNFFNYPHILILSTFLFSVQTFTHAQLPINNLYWQAENIKTVQLHTQTDSLAFPAVALATDDILILSFDEIEHDKRTLHYSLQHCNADWQQSDLLDIEFFEGFNKVFDADDAQFSFNTTTDYTHYIITISTSDIKLSGNYIIKVFDEDDNELLHRPFIVYESIIGIQSRLTRQKQAQTATQTLSVALLHPTLQVINAVAEIKIATWQNNNFWTWNMAATPTFIRHNELLYDNIATFEAGNEHRWADNRSLKYNGLSTSHIEYHDPFYHFTLSTDKQPVGYYFYEDFNGMQYIEARDIHYPATYAADYNIVHFTFQSQNIGNLYLFGELTEMKPQPMQYDPLNQIYYTNVLLKQGLHSYQYLNSENENISVAKTEGTYIETENDYYIAVYYRQLGDTVDRLIGYKLHNSKKTLNDFIK